LRGAIFGDGRGLLDFHVDDDADVIPNSNLPYCHFLSADDWQKVIDDWSGRVSP